MSRVRGVVAPPRARMTLAATCLGMAALGMNGTAIMAALPTMRHEADLLIADLIELTRLRQDIAAERDTLNRDLVAQEQERQRLALLTDQRQKQQTDDEKSLYAIGYLVGSRNLQSLSLKPQELEIVKRGLTDGATGKKAQVEPEAQMEKVNAFASARASRRWAMGKPMVRSSCRSCSAWRLASCGRRAPVPFSG